MYPGSIFGPLFAEQTEANIRQHALESACFAVCATAWLDADQQAQIMKDMGCAVGPISGGCFTAIVNPDGRIVGELSKPVSHLREHLAFCAALKGTSWLSFRCIVTSAGFSTGRSRQ